jgi:hypothetical protein
MSLVCLILFAEFLACVVLAILCRSKGALQLPRKAERGKNKMINKQFAEDLLSLAKTPTARRFAERLLRTLPAEAPFSTRPARFCPNHPDRESASPASNLCGPCLMGKIELPAGV